jgi:hypothetical protein
MSGPSNEIVVFFSSLPHWVLFVLVVVWLIAGIAINNRIVSWLRSRFPWMVRPKVVLATFALSLMTIALGLWVYPPSKAREEFQRAHPELFSKPASSSPIER